MNTFVLTAETRDFPVRSLLDRAGSNGVEIRDRDGNILGYLLTANAPDTATYIEAGRELDRVQEEVREASQRHGGVSTAELLQRAEEAARDTEGAGG